MSITSVLFPHPSPKNILVACLDPLCLKITDFGVSKQAFGTYLTTLCGTALYSAPETIGIIPSGPNQAKFPDYALDIWAFGILIYELLTSKLPFTILESSKPTEEYSGLVSDMLPNRMTDFALLI